MKIRTAIRFNNIKRVKRILEKGYNPNERIDGVLPLHYAVLKGSISIIILLLVEFGANIHILNWDKKSPLRVAVERKSIKCVRLLLKLGANPNEMCAYNKHGAEILKKNDARYKYSEPYHLERVLHPLFHLACLSGVLEIVKAFVDNDVKVNAVDSHGGFVLEIYDYNKTNIPLDILDYLIKSKNRLNINRKDRFGSHIVFNLIIIGEFEAAEVLMQAGAIINYKYPNGKSSSIQAMRVPYAIGISMLIHYGLDVNIPGEGNTTMLHIAASSSRDMAMEEILQTFQNINAQDDSGGTALHYCISRHTVYLLVNAGIDVKIYLNDSDRGCVVYKQFFEFPSLKLLCFRQLRRTLDLDKIRDLIPHHCMKKSTNGVIYKQY